MGREHLSFRQILEAVQQLPVSQRKNLVDALTRRPAPEDVLQVARRLRPAFRLPLEKQKRLSLLLRKGNKGTLTPEERKEVDALVEEVEIKRLELAEAVAATVKSDQLHKGRDGSTGR
jgi:hypothetical protein